MIKCENCGSNNLEVIDCNKTVFRTEPCFPVWFAIYDEEISATLICKECGNEFTILRGVRREGE